MKFKNISKNNIQTEKIIDHKVKISNILRQSNIFLLHNINHKKQLLTEISIIVEKSSSFSKKEVLQLLLDKEKIENSGIGGGVALPNINLSNMRKSLGIFIKLNKSISYNASDNEPVDLIFLLISPTNDIPIHLNELAYISRFLTKKKTLQNLRSSIDKETIYAIITNEL
jgi:PTS system nitrogen regulatory IIA component